MATKGADRILPLTSYLIAAIEKINGTNGSPQLDLTATDPKTKFQWSATVNDGLPCSLDLATLKKEIDEAIAGHHVSRRLTLTEDGDNLRLRLEMQLGTVGMITVVDVALHRTQVSETKRLDSVVKDHSNLISDSMKRLTAQTERVTKLEQELEKKSNVIDALIQAFETLKKSIQTVKDAMPGPQTFLAQPTSSVTLSTANKWAPIAELSLEVTLKERRLVIANYSVCTGAGTSNVGDQHFCTRLDVDRVQQSSTYAITGNVPYWSNVAVWSQVLDAGVHTFSVHYRTPGGATLLTTSTSEWQGSGLRVTVI